MLQAAGAGGTSKSAGRRIIATPSTAEKLRVAAAHIAAHGGDLPLGLVLPSTGAGSAGSSSQSAVRRTPTAATAPVATASSSSSSAAAAATAAAPPPTPLPPPKAATVKRGRKETEPRESQPPQQPQAQPSDASRGRFAPAFGDFRAAKSARSEGPLAKDNPFTSNRAW